eukprot:g8270.t1
MLRRLIVFVVLISCNVNCSASTGQNLTYSFRIPEQWGQLTIEAANCCPYFSYPSNKTSERQFLPHLIGLGVQKSGSTTLSWYLSSHPDFALSRPKETHFMDSDYNKSSLMRYEEKWLGRKAKAKATYRFEFTPSYFWVPFAACRIKNTFPNMKFAVILRNPADRAYSEYNMVRARCKGSDGFCLWRKKDFLKVVNTGIENLRRKNCSFNDGKDNKNWNDCFGCMGYLTRVRKDCHNRPYFFKREGGNRECLFFSEQIISRGLYAAQLAWWFSLFPPENFVVILSHDFYKDPLIYLNRIEGLIGAERKYEKWMLPKDGKAVGMKGAYKYDDSHKDEAKEIMKEFYNRANFELYQLLDSVNHGPYTPFEPHQVTTSLASSAAHEENQATISNTLVLLNTTLISLSNDEASSFRTFFPSNGTTTLILMSVILLIVVLWHGVNFNRTRAC